MDTTGFGRDSQVPSGESTYCIPRRRLLGLLGAAVAAPLTGWEAESANAKRKRKRSTNRRGRLGAEQGSNGNANATETLFRDDFIHGFDIGSADSDWFYFSAGPFVGDDGEESTGPHGLRVSADRFRNTIPQEHQSGGLPGGLDHVKWLAYANRLANGVPGFAAEPGRELIVEAIVSARTFGTENHPFGAAVADPDDDLRLASAALNGIDFESWMVFDVFLTNKRLYAFYERLPFGRGGPLGDYASFSFQIPLLERRPGDEHKVGIAYDRSAGVVRWLVDGKERFRVDRIGHRIDRTFLTLDHGGKEETVEPKQLGFGMGLFTLLDGSLPSGEALVRLSTAPDFYFDPVEGEPTPQTFVDEESRPGSRLFGQGAELRVERFTVQSRRA